VLVSWNGVCRDRPLGKSDGLAGFHGRGPLAGEGTINQWPKGQIQGLRDLAGQGEKIGMHYTGDGGLYLGLACG